MYRLRGKGPSLRQIRGNIHSHLLPDGNLISALFDRQLMMWSDRGGASRDFGDRWSERVSEALAARIGAERPLPGDDVYRLEAVVRLDDDVRIAEQAGRHKLTNPDFVLFGRRTDGTPILQAADAKFAVDTIKPNQVSAEALQALLDVEHGLVRQALEQDIHDHDVIAAVAMPGIFVSPVGPLTDYFLPRLLSDPRHLVDRGQIELIDADPVGLFEPMPPGRLISQLARLDHLATSPRTNLLAAMYYYRVACACAWLWIEDRTPLLARDPHIEVDVEALSREVQSRAVEAESAYGLVTDWFNDVEIVSRNRKSLDEVMSLPVRMSEIRQLVERAGAGDDRRMVRMVRASLDRAFRARVIDLVGDIPAHPREPLGDVLMRVAEASRTQRPEMVSMARTLVAEYVEAQAAEEPAAG
ncbi:MAG TPA: hypothetical protein VF201_00115 [Nitrolancea sp.]